MREISYVLRFERANQSDSTVATGLQTTTIFPGGGTPVETTRQTIPSMSSAYYENQFELHGNSFTETGTITFEEEDVVGGDPHTLSFSTIDQGWIFPDQTDPQTGMTPGIVMWKVDSGTGYFAGATGLISSNFRVNIRTEALIDDHVATIWLPD